MFLPQSRPSVIRGNQSQYTNPQVRFAPDTLSPIKKPINHPSTSTTSNFINTTPRKSANVNTTPAQNSNLVISSTDSEMVKDIVNEYNRHRFTYTSGYTVRAS